MDDTITRRSDVAYIKTKDIRPYDIVVINYRQKPVCFRVIAMSGDSIRIDSSYVYVNNKLQDQLFKHKGRYLIAYKNNILPQEVLDSVASHTSFDALFEDSTVLYTTTQLHYLELKKDENVSAIIPFYYADHLDRPIISDDNCINLKSIKIPGKKEMIRSNDPMKIYGQKEPENFQVRGKLYFLLSDNWSELPDSRQFGLVPADSILGVVKKVKLAPPIWITKMKH